MSDPAAPMFSIIMPVYNHARYVGEAIESVAAQTRGDWELWVVDDGSTDGSAAIIDQWAGRDSRIRAIHQSNAGTAPTCRGRPVTTDWSRPRSCSGSSSSSAAAMCWPPT